MTQAFIEKTLKIGCSKERLWTVLTDLEISKQWLSGFSPGTYMETDWSIGSTLYFKYGEGEIGATGRVSVYDENKLIHIDYTEDENPSDNPNESWEGYAERFEFSNSDDGITLLMTAGPLPEEHYNMHLAMWDQAASKIKEVAEGV